MELKIRKSSKPSSEQDNKQELYGKLCPLFIEVLSVCKESRKFCGCNIKTAMFFCFSKDIYSAV